MTPFFSSNFRDEGWDVDEDEDDDEEEEEKYKDGDSESHDHKACVAYLIFASFDLDLSDDGFDVDVSVVKDVDCMKVMKMIFSTSR